MERKSTLKKVTRLFMVLVLIAAQVAISIPALAEETVSTTSTVTVNGVEYTTFLKQGQAQLTVGNKAILLSKENVMAAVTVDQYGTAWTISYSGRCAGYNYELQKNEPTANLHTYLNNAEQFITNGNYSTAVQTTTGTVNLPNLEEFKKLAGIASSNNNSTSEGNTSNNNTGNNNTENNNTGNGTAGNLNLVETKSVGGKQYTIVLTNGTAQVVIDNKIITIPDMNICEFGLDSNGTIIFVTNNNGIKEARWYSPTLQTEVWRTNVLANNVTCLLKNGSGFVTGVLGENSSIVNVLTVDEQKKILGIVVPTPTPVPVPVSTPTPTPVPVPTTKNNQEGVRKVGDYTYAIYDSEGKRFTSYKFKNKTVTWRGYKFRNVKRVCAIRKSKNLALTTFGGSVEIVSFETLQKKTIFTATERVKAVKYTYGNRGFGVSFVTSDGTRRSLKNY